MYILYLCKYSMYIYDYIDNFTSSHLCISLKQPRLGIEVEPTAWCGTSVFVFHPQKLPGGGWTGVIILPILGG